MPARCTASTIASALLVLAACRPPASSPRAFEAGSSCPFLGSSFGAVTVGGDVVLSLFELDTLQRLRLSDCAEQQRWAVGPGPRALTALGSGFVTATSTGLTLGPASGSSSSLTTAPGATALLTADLDRDGAPDLIATHGSTAADARVRVFAVDAGALVQTQELLLDAAAALASVDVDGDSDLDVVVARTGDHLLTVLENSGGTLTRGQDVPVCDEPFAVTALPGPGLPTLVVTCRTGGLELLRATAGSYARQPLARDGTLYQTLALDLDLDGFVDLASVDPFAHRLVLWWGKGSGAFEPPVELVTPRGPILLRALNLDSHNPPALLVLAFQDRSVTVFRPRDTR